MNIVEAITQRKSTRAFLDRDVSEETIKKVLQVARYAPSGTNAQPWQVAVVRGPKKQEIIEALLLAFEKDGPGPMDYEYYPQVWKNPFKKRRVICGSQLYGAIGIARKDKEGRRRQWLSNYRGFDAPVLLFFFLDTGMATGSILDYGMFLQSFMLAAMEEGLATCAQAALGQFSDITRNILGYSEGYTLLCGMAVGYEDKEASVNNYRTQREDVEAFTTFHR